MELFFHLAFRLVPENELFEKQTASLILAQCFRQKACCNLGLGQRN